MHNVLFCAHTLCMNYVTNTFPLVSSFVRSKQLLCFVRGQGEKTTITTDKEFYNHSLRELINHLKRIHQLLVIFENFDLHEPFSECKF